MINLSSGWDQLWSAVSRALGSSVTQLMLVIGVGLIAAAFIGWIWKRRRSGGGGMQDMSAIWWTMGIGAILAAPDLVLPLILNLVDAVVNAGANILKIAR